MNDAKLLSQFPLQFLNTVFYCLAILFCIIYSSSQGLKGIGEDLITY